MSNLALRNKIERIQADMASIRIQPAVHYKLLGVPRHTATNAEKSAYQAEFDAALAQGFKIIRLVPLTKKGVRPWQTGH